MKPLHARSRALIDAARPAEEPSRDDRARVRARVMASLAGSAAVTVASAAKAAGGAGAASGAGAVTGAAAGSGITKAVILGALLGLFASGAAEIALPPPRPAAPPAPLAASGPLPKVPGATSSPAASTPTPPGDDTAARPVPPTSGAPMRSAARPEPTPTAPAGAASVHDEIELLKDAQRAIVAGETDRALALLDTHASRFEAGAFKGERLAARAIALCGAGRDAEARRAAAEFFAAAPGSQLEGRVRAACSRVLSGEPEKR